jgi:hypothetical protein
MSFKAKNIQIGKIPKWVVEQASPTISWDRHKEFLEEHTESLEKKIKNQSDRLNYLEPKDENSLSGDELMFLLHFIKEANFKGGQLEHVFQVTLKLQNQYRFLEKNNNKDQL